ncbi:hypothetical protein [uncultured Methanoculleus sp.]|uniref:hypothetical protein n=1 Tax=uncultured Methanoculleus sp. TaxID=183762 RepID=UPI00319DA571|nr:hypothetical protein [Methanoculleus sp.]
MVDVLSLEDRLDNLPCLPSSFVEENIQVLCCGALDSKIGYALVVPNVFVRVQTGVEPIQSVGVDTVDETAVVGADSKRDQLSRTDLIDIRTFSVLFKDVSGSCRRMIDFSP